MQNVNPGLSRRFKIEDAFNFEDFSDMELLQILEMKLKSGDLDATDSAKKVALELLIRMRNRPNFGNAGEVENVITQAKARCVARRAKLSATDRPINIVFEPQDFDPDFNRGVTATANLVKLFDDVIGCDDIIDRLKGYQELALVCKKTDKDPRDLIPMNFVFTGPPGKTACCLERSDFSTHLQFQGLERQQSHERSARSSMIWAYWAPQKLSSVRRPTLLGNT